MDDFKAVYKGSRSILGGRLLDLTFVGRLRDFEDITGVEELIPGAGLLKAEGSISTILCAKRKRSVAR